MVLPRNKLHQEHFFREKISESTKKSPQIIEKDNPVYRCSYPKRLQSIPQDPKPFRMTTTEHFFREKISESTKKSPTVRYHKKSQGVTCTSSRPKRPCRDISVKF